MQLLPGEEAQKFPTGPLSYSESLEWTLASIRAFNPTPFEEIFEQIRMNNYLDPKLNLSLKRRRPKSNT